MKRVMNFLIKNKTKIIVISTIILVVLSLIIAFNKDKSNLSGNINNSNKGNNAEYISPNFGDTNFLFNSNVVSFSDSVMKSKNVQTTIDELYQALTTGCYVGYTKGTDNGTTYVCNKSSSDSAGTVDFDSINVKYNNGTSGLTASNVKAAILELANSIGYCKDNYHKENETSSSYDCKINTQPSTLTVTNNSVALTYNGSSVNNTYSYNGDGEISCTSSDPTKVTCTVDTANNKVTVSPVGATSTAVTITVSATATQNYYAPENATFTVSVAPLEASFTCSNKTYTGSSQTACTCTGCTLGTGCSATNAGSYTCKATANANYTLSTTSIGWTMNKATGWITINTKPSSVSCGGTTTVTVNGSHGGTISCSSNNTSYVTCSGTTITGNASGSATVTCTSAATTNYNAASTSWQVTTGACTSWHYNSKYSKVYFCSDVNGCNIDCKSSYGSSTQWSCVSSNSTAPSSASLKSGLYCWCYY